MQELASWTWYPSASSASRSPTRIAGSSSITMMRLRATSGLRHREVDGDHAAAPIAIRCPHPAPVLVDDPHHDREPEPGAALPATEERLEHPGQILGRESGSLVGDHAA